MNVAMDREILEITSVHETGGMYSHAVRAGNLLFVAGQVARDRDNALVGKDDIETQARQVYANLRSVLREAGSDLDGIVAMTTYLTSRDSRAGFRKVRDEVFVTPAPANTLVFVSGLAEPEYLIEVQAIAMLGGPE